MEYHFCQETPDNLQFLFSSRPWKDSIRFPMNFSRTFISLVVIIICGFGIFEFTRPDYPLFTTLTNKEGRTLKAKIVGKEGNSLFIERQADGAKFDIPADSLVLRDRIFSWRLRNSPRPSAGKKKEDRYIQIRRDEIEVLKNQEELFEKELNSGTLDETMIRKRNEDLAKVRKEISSLELSIETYNYQRKK